MAANQSSDSLRGLVQSLVTRSPEEVMGSAATSSLWSSVVAAAAGMIGMIVVATVLIYFVFGPPELKARDEPQPAASVPVATTNPATDATAGGAAPAQATDAAASADSDPMDAAEAMGIGETKDPDAKPDTLDNRLDDLLKGLE